MKFEFSFQAPRLLRCTFREKIATTNGPVHDEISRKWRRLAAAATKTRGEKVPINSAGRAERRRGRCEVWLSSPAEETELSLTWASAGGGEEAEVDLFTPDKNGKLVNAVYRDFSP